ncbi:10861_t:CDS:2 [Paraglomus occultum]|uniref:10861_t:CDS:1 n=1 Tax=Paraglomus occultum TaxID=144539 RepID=A0A9N9FP99_9GLOM|nr:10861_t:CDS:2 [Paraglomus occultum]
MQYMEGGNLRQYLQQKKLTFRDKLDRLRDIISGLKDIHQQNLIHRDLHSGNILNSNDRSYVADLGLSQSVNSQKGEGQVFGVLPYVAPEVLQGQPYTQASDIYSFGIVAYELLANTYPYSDLNLEDTNLALKICQGLRPDVDELKIPPLMKDLIKSSPINTKEIVLLSQKPEKRALEPELKKLEKEIDQPLTEEQKVLISDFIQARKMVIKDRNNEEAEDRA